MFITKKRSVPTTDKDQVSAIERRKQGCCQMNVGGTRLQLLSPQGGRTDDDQTQPCNRCGSVGMRSVGVRSWNRSSPGQPSATARKNPRRDADRLFSP